MQDAAAQMVSSVTQVAGAPMGADERRARDEWSLGNSLLVCQVSVPFGLSIGAVRESPRLEKRQRWNYLLLLEPLPTSRRGDSCDDQLASDLLLSLFARRC